MEFRLKKISILGCGWLGKPLGKKLVLDGYEVLGSTTTEAKIPDLKNLGIQPFVISFSPAKSTKDPDVFFNSEILIVSIPPRRKSGDKETYFLQMEEVVKECVKGEIKKIIFISSTSVYPDVNRVVSEEDQVVDGESNSLVRAEKLFSSLKEIKTTILRFGGLIGENRHPGRFLAGKVDVKGGDSPINVIHLKDCISIIEKIIKTDCFGEVFNACADQHPTKKDFYLKASETLSLPLPVFLNERKEERSFKIVSSEKLKHSLNYKFHYSDPFSML